MAGCRCPQGFCHLWGIVSDSNINEAFKYVMRRINSTPLCTGTHEEYADEASRFINNWQGIKEHILAGQYHPAPYILATISNDETGKIRCLDVPSFRDRVILRSVSQLLSPILSQLLPPSVHGWRVGYNVHSAVKNLGTLAKFNPCGWILRADIRNAFDSLNHDLIQGSLREFTSCSRLLHLLRGYLTNPSRDNPSQAVQRVCGVPTGTAIGPMVCNAVMLPVDQKFHRHGWIRYGDDIALVVPTSTKANNMREDLQIVLGAMRLRMSPHKTQVYQIGNPDFEFLGHSLNKEGDLIMAKSTRDKWEKLDKANAPRIRGWRAYYGQCKDLPKLV